jgi:hypothetical protein
MRVLVADDNPVARTTLEAVLMAVGNRLAFRDYVPELDAAADRRGRGYAVLLCAGWGGGMAKIFGESLLAHFFSKQRQGR